MSGRSPVVGHAPVKECVFILCIHGECREFAEHCLHCGRPEEDHAEENRR